MAARLARIAALVLVLAGIGYSVSQSNILTCSVSVPSHAICTYERIGWSLFNLEGGVGATVRFDPDTETVVSARPFVVLGYYGSESAWWIEVTTPEGILPVIGEDNAFVVVGGEYRW